MLSNSLLVLNSLGCCLVVYSIFHGNHTLTIIIEKKFFTLYGLVTKPQSANFFFITFLYWWGVNRVRNRFAVQKQNQSSSYTLFLFNCHFLFFFQPVHFCLVWILVLKRHSMSLLMRSFLPSHFPYMFEPCYNRWCIRFTKRGKCLSSMYSMHEIGY